MTKKTVSSKISAEGKSAAKPARTQPAFAPLAQTMLQAIQDDAASKQATIPPGLLLIASPIGNLGDITLRALWALTQVDAVLCEDTRVTGALLHQYGIKKPLVSCHDHNEAARVKEVLSRLEQGQTLALVSDAGTPMISDPGYRLARACRDAGHTVTALPGASAILTALVCAGLPTDRFLFVGFLPTKTNARQQALRDVAASQATLVFYEAPHRLAATLRDMAATLGETRDAVVTRELTKLHEEVRGGTLGALAQEYQDGAAPKGEIVILVAAADPAAAQETAPDTDALLREALKTMSLRDAVAQVTKISGLKRSEVYARALKL